MTEADVLQLAGNIRAEEYGEPELEPIIRQYWNGKPALDNYALWQAKNNAYEVTHGTQEWKELRYSSIGSSDAPTLYGEAEYRGPGGKLITKTIEDLVRAKAHRIDDFEYNKYLYWGSLLEASIAQHVYNEAVRIWPDCGLIKPQHVFTPKGMPFMTSSPDYLLFKSAGDQDPIIVEIKSTAASQKSKLAKEGLPKRHEIQVRHQMACFDTKPSLGIVVILCGGNSPFVELVERDEEWEKEHIELCKHAFTEIIYEREHGKAEHQTDEPQEDQTFSGDDGSDHQDQP